jgi:hypothetical protein
MGAPMTFERKLAEQSFLLAPTFPHHRQRPSPQDRIERMARPVRKGFGNLV